MPNEFTAVVERDGEWFIAYSPEVPGANGQGITKEEALNNLVEAIELVLEDRREDGLRGDPRAVSILLPPKHGGHAYRHCEAGP